MIGGLGLVGRGDWRWVGSIGKKGVGNRGKRGVEREVTGRERAGERLRMVGG